MATTAANKGAAAEGEAAAGACLGGEAEGLGGTVPDPFGLGLASPGILKEKRLADAWRDIAASDQCALL